ncbi:MAG: sugar ABC transporter permease [bacterium]|nr:sugar ABC transporter permease [bacterium]
MTSLSGLIPSWPRLRHIGACYAVLCAPVALLALFVYLPVIWAFSKSLYDFEIGGEVRFVGLANYIEFFTQDPTTYVAIRNVLIFTTAAVLIRLSVPLVVAKLIISLPNERWRHFYRVLFLLPVVVSGVAVLLIWTSLIYSQNGLLNELLRALGLQRFCRTWLGDPATAMGAVIFIGFPWVGGFEVLIYYAGLAAIPETVNEAARLEGCTGVRKFLLIDIPMVMSQLKLMLVLTIIAGIQSFQNLLIVTRGGPGYATYVPGLQMYYNAFSYQRFGYACAIGVLLFFLIFGLTILNMKYFKSSEELQAST